MSVLKVTYQKIFQYPFKIMLMILQKERKQEVPGEIDILYNHGTENIKEKDL